MINIILVLIFILVLFMLINKYINVQENMSMKSGYFNKKLNEKGYTMDPQNFSIYDNNNNLVKKYPTIYFNSKEANQIAKNKPLTNSILLKNNIPTPIHVIITNANKNDFKNASKYFPCVLKPVDGMQGKDVYTHIDNQQEFDTILNQLLNNYDKIMLENLIEGNNYRIFVFNNEVMDVIEREKPAITGNGKSTVQELINQKNNELLSKNLFPVKYLDEKLIKQQGYNLDSIVKPNQKVYITNTINFHNGANAKRIPLNQVNKENKEMFIKAHKLIGLECSGVDYMSNNINIPYYKNKGVIIEMNSMVDTKIHIDADEKKNSNLLFQNMIETL
jgi:cyanophycin synthetase